MKKDNVIQIYSGDPRAGALYDALLDAIEQHSDGMPFVTVVGTLEVVKMTLNEMQNKATEERGF